MNSIKFAIILVISSSCAFIDHRDYEDQMLDEHADTMLVPQRDFPVIAGDTGIAYMQESEIKRRTPASVEERELDLYSSTLNRELSMLESSLDEIEVQKYMMVKDKLGNISSRIYYLRLHPDDRSPYLANRGILPSQSYQYGQAVPFMPEIGLGMDKESVISAWGRPIRQDIAGDPADQNERWSYMHRGRVKYLYFERGRVEGWSN